MSTKLELCQKIRQRCNIAGNGPSTTVNQTGEYELIVSWLDDVYEELQLQYKDWKFLQSIFNVQTSAGMPGYSVADLAEWKVADVRSYLTSKGQSDEQYIYWCTWEEFRLTYMFGTQASQTGRPVQFTISPDNQLTMWPIPDDIYTITGEYYKVPDVMDTDDDEPVFPVRFHQLLTWMALVYYGADYVETDKFIFGEKQYEKFLSGLRLDQLPTVAFGLPLA